MIRKLLDGRLVMTPNENLSEFAITGVGVLDRLVGQTFRGSKEGLTPGGSARRGQREGEHDGRVSAALNLVVDLATTITVEAA